MRSDHLQVQHAADHRLHCRTGAAFRDMPLGVVEVADARRKPKAQEVHQREDVISETCCVGVVLLDRRVRLVVWHAARYTGRIAHADVRHLRAERHVLIRDVGVKKLSRLGAALRVDVTRASGLGLSVKALPVQRGGDPVAPTLGERLAKLRIDQLDPCCRTGLVSNVPSSQSRQLGVGRAWARLVHLGQAEVDCVGQDWGQRNVRSLAASPLLRCVKCCVKSVHSSTSSNSSVISRCGSIMAI